MKRRVIAGVVAAVLAIVGAVLVLNYVGNADARALTGRNPVEVYVSNKVIPTGTTLTAAKDAGLITLTKVPSDAQPAGALSKIDASNGSQVALSDLAPGQFVLAAAFGTTPLTQKAINVPDGKLAMSVSLSDPARVGQFVTPGSHLAIYATYGIKSTGIDEKSKAFNELDAHGTTVLLSDVEVIGMGETPLSAPSNSDNPAGSDGSGADKKASSSASPSSSASTSNAASSTFLVTLAVTPKDAVRLAHAVNGYTLYAGLRGQNVKVGPDDTANDFNEFGAGARVMLPQVP